MTTFEDLGVAPIILRALAAENYTVPTPIQAQALPIVMQGKDMIALSQTGTGKTAAFTLPMLHRLQENRVRATPKGCRVVILTPTRELAMQIDKRIQAYGQFMKIKTVVIVGGMAMGPQITRLGQGVDIVVATPGRLLDHLEQRTIHLNDVQINVLDEADQMMDMGFAPALKKIAEKLPKERQTLLFSATMADDMRQLASAFVRNPVQIKTEAAGRAIDSVTQRAFFIDASNKRVKATQLLLQEAVTSAIVFTRTKYGADRLSVHLQSYGIKAAAIHGDKSQAKRTRALSSFKEGRVRVLVATDVAARGIDVSGVSHVLNYEMPNVAETYVHRIGRTARAGAAGTAWSLVDHTERGSLKGIEKLLKMSIFTEDARKEKIELPEKVIVVDDAEDDRRDRRRDGGRDSSRGTYADGPVRYSKDEKREQSARRPGRKERENRRAAEGEQPRVAKRPSDYRPERHVEAAQKTHGDWAQARRARNQARAEGSDGDSATAGQHRKTGRKFIKTAGTSDYRSAHNRGGQTARKRSGGQGQNRPAFQGAKKGGKRG
jgi:ATP-dependent RNA helicase RhlE